MSSGHPHVPTANTCQNCDKHLRIVHSVTLRCDRCLPDDTPAMKTCVCHLARYCSAQCQTNDWEAHRIACRTASKNSQFARRLGVEARQRNFVDWCKHSRDQFHFPALWALGAGTDADRTATHFFVIYVDVDEEISTDKVLFQRRVRTAKCASEAELEQEFAGRYSNDGLPFGLESVDQVAEMIGIVKVRSQVFPGMECDWLAHLEESVAVGAEIPSNKYIHRPGSTLAIDKLRYAHAERWKASYREQFAMGAHSALDVARHPNRIVTNCLVVHVDVEEARQGMFGKNTIRDAKMLSLAELGLCFIATSLDRARPT
ncbi:hypothetical protein C8J57DRAFT_1628654 [Mycena rebaudengoi]|nr:hypothetical protein C8J57DRAFT_1628654 [Mycena rebaudengoi]